MEGIDPRLLALPDWVYGPRVRSALGFGHTAGGTLYGTLVSSLPDLCLIWRLWVVNHSNVAGYLAMGLRFCDGGKATATSYGDGENVFAVPGVGTWPAGEFLSAYRLTMDFPMRAVVRSGGRGICVKSVNNIASAANLMVVLEWSAVPKEVPVWAGQRVGGVQK